MLASRLYRWLFPPRGAAPSRVEAVQRRRVALEQVSNEELGRLCRATEDLLDVIAAAAVAARRVLELDMFDVQIQGALALAEGKIAEMQTGEGKTLAAVPAVVWYAKAGLGVHVMTVNDYLARRDARWMGGIYELLGYSCAFVQQRMSAAERRRAYACDITYATANEIGFDFLRDQLALRREDQVLRPFAAAVVDEADSILIDEARLPLVIAGGESGEAPLAERADCVVRRFHRGAHYTVDEYGRNVALTDAGIRAVESAFARGNLFDEENLDLLSAVQDAVHAHALLRRDIDYLVKNSAIESVDEFKGRIAQDRRWPAGLHAAIEAKEGVALQRQGRILGSITLQNLLGLYPRACGMTGTAATQAEEFRAIYGLEVEAIPTHRPVIRSDRPDVLFRSRRDKELAVIEEIRRAHASGQPVLVGTASVAESERLSALLGATPRQVLNARNEELEAAAIARAGERGAVTISTNMAGRGADIRLGEGVAELGGLYVIGVNRHEARRIDRQLRGRAGRQGDPGASRFFVSLEDDLILKYGSDDPRLRYDPEGVQRLVEGQNLEIRRFLRKYESAIEGQRQIVQRRRQGILSGETAAASELERLAALTAIDDLWSQYLEAVADLRQGVHWVSWGGRDPLHEYLVAIHEMFQALDSRIEEETQLRLEQARAAGLDAAGFYLRSGATWTYLTTDQPFGTWTERVFKGLARRFAARGLRGG